MPRIKPGLIAYIVFLLLLFGADTAHAKGLRTEQLGNTEKQEIADSAKKIRDHPDDGDIAFAESQKLIDKNHVEAFNELKDLYEKGTAIIKTKIVKAIGVGRDKIVEAPQYWTILEQALGSTEKNLAEEVVICLRRLESEEYFGRLLEKIKVKDTSKAAMDNTISVLCLPEEGPSNLLSTGTLGQRIQALQVLSERGEKDNESKLMAALASKFGEEFAGRDDVAKWWDRNKDKSIAQILDEANRKLRRKHAAAQEDKKALKQKLVNERKAKLKLILQYDEKKAIQLFLDEAANPDPSTVPEVLEYTIKELARLKVKDALGLVKRHLGSEHVTVRIASIEAMGAIGNSDILPEIENRLQAENLNERLAAIGTTATLGGHKAADMLLEILKGEQNPLAQRALVQGLGQIGLPVAVKPLVNLQASVSAEGEVILRDTATDDFLFELDGALGRILSSGNECDKATRLLAIDFMLATLAVGKDQVKYKAIENLGIVGADKATSVLVNVLNTDPNPGIRAAAGRALGKMPEMDDTVENSLLLNLKDKNNEVAEACMWSLRNIAGLNGSERQTDLDMLLKWSTGLETDDAYELVRLLLKNLPEESVLKTADEESRDKLYKLRGALGIAHMKAKDHKAAQIEFEKVVGYLKGPKETILKFREMLAQTYAASKQLAKAIEEYELLIKMVEPPQATRYWNESLTLIERIEDDPGKLKRVEKALQLEPAPPQMVKEELERLKQEISARLPKEQQNP
jgi:HEAT repeat protein